MLRRLQRFGEYEANPQGSRIEYSEIVDLILVPFAATAAADPHGFCTDLQAVVARDDGGYATFGAARLVWELLVNDQRTIPPAIELVKAGIAFKRAHRLPLTFFEMDIAAR
jgi:hypothetical protein